MVCASCNITSLQYEFYVAVFSVTLLVYDVMINFPLEVQHIWTRKWTFLTVLYVLQRYLPFFDSAGLVLNNHFGANLSTRTCLVGHNIAAWSITVGIGFSEIILTLRIWAVWRRSIPVGVGLVVFFLACWVPGYILLAQFLSSMEFALPPIPSFRGCFISGGSDILYLCWVLMMVYDAGALVMILIPTVTAYRSEGRSGLIKTVYRDGGSLLQLDPFLPTHFDKTT
ncbi:hypothetical protein L218DRAFT_881608 [Marasmius fiardii PR-910]|nr:hypothetical protein L218DRAFT_881608 [Marasmius fiardii PR-910]